MSNAQRTIEDKTPEASATTCVVGCRLPHGLILQLRYNKDGRPDRRGAYRPRDTMAHRLNGANASRIVGGAGFTENVPTEFMTEWLKQNADHPAVVSYNVFMHTEGRSAESMARESKGQVTGLEAINPVTSSKKFGIAVDDEAAAAYRLQQTQNPMRNRQLVVE